MKLEEVDTFLATVMIIGIMGFPNSGGSRIETQGGQ